MSHPTLYRDLSASLAPTDFHLHGDTPIDLTAAQGAPGRFSGVVYSGGELRVPGFDLPVVADLRGMTSFSLPRPILKDHEQKQVVGHAESVEIGSTEITASGVISGAGDAAKEVVESSRNGFPWKPSIGCQVIKARRIPKGQSVTANGRTFQGPVYHVTRSNLYEISFVALPGDVGSSLSIAAQSTQTRGISTMTYSDWLRSNGFDPETLTEQQSTTLRASYDAEQGITATASPVATLREEAAGEADRIAGVRKALADHPSLLATAIREDWSRDRAELEGFKAEMQGGPAIHVRHGNAANSADVLEASLVMRASGEATAERSGYSDQTLQAARDCGIHSMVDLCAASLRADMQPVPGDRNAMIKAAFSTMGLSNILSNAANKSLQDEYTMFPSAARKIARQLTASDFKTHTGYSLTLNADLEELPPDGQIAHGTFDEGSFSYSVATYAKMYGITRQDIINDDLGAFDAIPRKMARSAVSKLEEVFFTLVLANTSSFFSAGNSNLKTGAGSALAASGLADAVTAFLTMVDADSKPINVTPRWLLVPPELKVTADELYASRVYNSVSDGSADDYKIATANAHYGKYEPLVSPYLSNSSLTNNSQTAWYLMADAAMGAFGIAFLNNQSRPTIETEDAAFNTLGQQFRCYWDFGVCQVDSNTAVKSDGS